MHSLRQTPFKSSKVLKAEIFMETKIYKIASQNDESINEVANLLKAGKLVAIPTETVYGLGANALDGKAVKKIFEAKGRPSDNPLIVHISDISSWNALVKGIPEKALRLAEKFWPGPLTIILEKADIIPNETSGGLSTVAVRMPSHKTARAIIEKAGIPLAAPSANTSGKPSPTKAKYVIEDLCGKVDAIVDGGDCDVGVESTVISLANEKPILLRPGGVTVEMIEEVIGEIEIADAVYNKLAENVSAPSPGMKYKHYSPGANVVIIKGSLEGYKEYLKKNADENDVALCFEEDKDALDFIRCITYGKENDSFSQAARIFDALRETDELKAKNAFARFPDMKGMGLAVFNRLVRAAGFNIIEV